MGWPQLAPHCTPPPLAGWAEKIERTGTRKLVGLNKDREITYQLLSWAKQTQLREFNLIYCQLKQSAWILFSMHLTGIFLTETCGYCLLLFHCASLRKVCLFSLKHPLGSWGQQLDPPLAFSWSWTGTALAASLCTSGTAACTYFCWAHCQHCQCLNYQESPLGCITSGAISQVTNSRG